MASPSGVTLTPALSIDSEESDIKRAPLPFSQSLFAPETKVTRTQYLKLWGLSAFFISVAVFAIFSIYWGALWKTPVHPFSGWIVDFDGGEIGQAVTRGLTNATASSRIHWTILPASNFPNGPSDLMNHVLRERVWVAIAVNPNSTARLQGSITNPDPSYDGTQAMTIYAEEARNENAFRLFIRPTVQQEMGLLLSQFTLRVAETVQTLPTNVSAILEKSPQIFSQPVGYQLLNIRPFDVPVATSVTFVGLIYLLILSFFLVVSANNARLMSGIERNLSTYHLVALRMASSFVGYFFISLCYSLLSVAFQLPLNRVFGHGGFIIFWMLNYVGMLSVGLALESMIVLFTPRFIPFFLLTLVMSNVSVCLQPIEVLPWIYRYGYAMPFYNLSKGMRTIIFNTENHLLLNFGILIAWIVVSCITLPLVQIYVRRGQRN